MKKAPFPTTPTTPKTPKHDKRPHEVRIIGGQWKRTRLAVADKPGLRPTPDRVRETLFNWLASLAAVGGGELPGWQCVDAFAGTGALGLEAASRGAGAVLLCEQDPALVAQLLTIKGKLGADAVRVERGNGLTAIERSVAGSLHVVFLDPPFENPALYEPALRAAARALRPEGAVYLEAPRKWSDEELAAYGLESYRYLKAGAVHAHLLRPRAEGTA
ncbi:RsmD family RNA methyltransferase [Variovorax ginsengisoli]|uniref:16S rRNA (Guanine(966)-N(2))-methyltransferase RsmD n=1 Tax=Variovorax ginsengisoli TaxID=363844 RepID=A0ABT9S8E0_9BURK|nr:RsmD family RNA methyltransferase [Variovorax ginsengisoli]MDP9900609.1 16S rRNA (guanine(966)-N(2))-methyltransferase RsmD [Variovorax ginsengisoli]